MSVSKYKLFSALVAGAIALGSAAAGASAAPLSSANITAGLDRMPVEQVQHHHGHKHQKKWHKHKKYKKHIVYDRRYHGPRYRAKRPGYHYYNGYYYRTPWWLQGPGPAIVIRR